MQDEEKRLITALRQQGLSYTEIAKETGVQIGTIKCFCSRNKIKVIRCLQCGEVIEQTPHRKQKKFCSDRCRMTWWNHHPDKGVRHPHHTQICPVCKKEFPCYKDAKRTYCSRQCFNLYRKGAVINND